MQVSYSSFCPGIIAFIRVYIFAFPTWSSCVIPNSWYWLASYIVWPISSLSIFCIARPFHSLVHFWYEGGGCIFLWNVETRLPDNTISVRRCTLCDWYLWMFLWSPQLSNRIWAVICEDTCMKLKCNRFSEYVDCICTKRCSEPSPSVWPAISWWL